MFPSGSDRLPGLDGLRAASIALVLLGHLAGTPHFLRLSSFLFLGDLGNLGVCVFFVISGFLITTLLLNERETAGRIDLISFYGRRARRILPAAGTYLVAVAVLAALSTWVRISESDWLHAVTFTMNYQQNRNWVVGHLWSLSVEEQFYLIWPAAVVVLGRRGSLWLAGVAVATAPLWRVCVWAVWPYARDGIGETFPTVMDAIAVGCVLAGSAQWFEERTWYRPFLESRWLAAVVAAVAACNALDRHPAFYLSVGMTIRSIGIALIVHAAILRSNRLVSSALDSDAATGLGRMSYSLYLWQQPFLNRHQPGTLTAFPANVATAFLCAVLSFRCVESPVRRARQRSRLFALEKSPSEMQKRGGSQSAAEQAITHPAI